MLRHFFSFFIIGFSFGQIEYLQDIQPIFNNHCISCHSGTYGSGALELDSFERLIEGDSNNGPVVFPFNADSSLLYKVLLRDSVIVPNEPICCRMPKNADFVIIQENTWSQGNFMYVNDYDKKSSYVRKTGLDFKKGQIISNPMLIDYKLISALASLNLEKVSVIKNEITTTKKHPKILQCNLNFSLIGLTFFILSNTIFLRQKH